MDGGKEGSSMELEHGIFAVKLYELQQEYGRMQSRLRLFQEKDLEQVHRERERLQEEYQEQDLLLEETVRSCRCQTMARLAKLQRDYGRQAEDLLQTSLTAEKQDFGRDGRDRAEAVTLCAEFAMDFATQAMRYALITALNAMELQIRADKHTTEGDTDTYE